MVTSKIRKYESVISVYRIKREVLIVQSRTWVAGRVVLVRGGGGGGGIGLVWGKRGRFTARKKANGFIVRCGSRSFQFFAGKLQSVSTYLFGEPVEGSNLGQRSEFEKVTDLNKGIWGLGIKEIRKGL
jgi:hypothetical protein